jgi:hypothetical protein
MLRDQYGMHTQDKWKYCIGCNKKGHFFKNCDLINYIPDKDLLFEDINTTED